MPRKKTRKPTREEQIAQITALMTDPEYLPMPANLLADHLKLQGRARANLRRTLDLLVKRGALARRPDGTYWLGKSSRLAEGRLLVLPSGNGFVVLGDEQEDVFVSESDMSTALPGDRVKVRLENRRRPAGASGPAGRIVCVLERGRTLIVGTMRRVGRGWHAVPLDRRYRREIRITNRQEAKQQDRVVIRLLDWHSPDNSPTGEIVEVLGPADDPSQDTLAIMRHYGFADEFAREALQEAGRATALLNKQGARRDLREKFIFTIDPERARDFDDALSLERDGKGNHVLGVHIADVSHFVRPGSAIDEEARRRATSVYFCDKVLPMLPEQLSNGLCSLRPNEDRLTFSVFITFDKQGEPRKAEFARSIIRSRRRLTYRQALLALRAGKGEGVPKEEIAPDFVKLLKRVSALAQQLRARRFKQAALDLDLPEYEVVVGKNGLISGIRDVVNDESHQLIEECMIAANEAVDRELSVRGLKLLHRVHPQPAEEKIGQLKQQLEEMGFKPGDLSSRRNLSAFLDRIKDHPLAHDAKVSVLRSMKRAVYAPAALGHFGLAKKYYAHFTSPIRRYPDLVVHRILGAMLAKEPVPYQDSGLGPLGEHCSTRERIAEEAEQALLEIKKYRYLQQQVLNQAPAEHEAVVVNVKSFGMFVELVHLGVQGLVHVSNLGEGGRARRAGATPPDVLQAGSVSYRQGSKLTVFPVKVDFEQRRIDFALAGRPADDA